MRFVLLIFRYCHPTNRRKPQPGRRQPGPTYTRPPPLTPAAGAKYHRPHPQQSAGHSPLSRTLIHINRQDIQVFLSVATRPDLIESINSWISGICKDYPGIIPLGAMHPEQPDLEAETCGCGSLE